MIRILKLLVIVFGILNCSCSSGNPLPYEGVYHGFQLCADCPGKEVVLTISSDGYTRTSLYLGKDTKPVEEKGQYVFDSIRNLIVLEGITDGSHQYLFVGNRLKQLDIEGNEIVGDIASLYILKKKK